ncbi:MAG: OB-fold domain-containing protein [Methanoregula sp.]
MCGESGNGKFAGCSGTVVTFTVIHTAAGQYSMLTPYVLAIVKLDEGPKDSPSGSSWTWQKRRLG